MDEQPPRRKTAAQRDEIRMLRQEQISLYKTAVLKEQRERRSRLRHGEPVDESPQKKKRVGFDLGPRAQADETESLDAAPEDAVCVD